MPTTETIWTDFHQELLRFIARRVRDPEAAQDLLQEVFLKIHLKLPTLQQTDRLGAWVYRIARNTLLDYVKSPRHHAAVALSTAMAEALTDAPTPPDLTPALTRCLVPFLRELPAAARQALLQTELGPLSQKEYAHQLGLSYSGTKSRVQRAKQQLHTLFQTCCRISADRYGNIAEVVPRSPCGCRVC